MVSSYRAVHFFKQRLARLSLDLYMLLVLTFFTTGTCTKLLSSSFVKHKQMRQSCSSTEHCAQHLILPMRSNSTTLQSTFSSLNRSFTWNDTDVETDTARQFPQAHVNVTQDSGTTRKNLSDKLRLTYSYCVCGTPNYPAVTSIRKHYNINVNAFRS